MSMPFPTWIVFYKKARILGNFSSILFFISTMVTSCTHYIDCAKTTLTRPFMDGKMQFYHDSNLLVFKSNMRAHSDSYIWRPKSFQTKLPKHLKWYDSDYFFYFNFYYKSKQTIAISIDLEKTSNKPDTFYTPNKSEIDSVISKTYHPREKYDLSRIEFIQGRKNLVIVRKDAYILLYNIKRKNYESFLNDLKTFKFL